MADAPTLRETLEAAYAHDAIARPPRSELKQVTEARAEFRQTFREALRPGDGSLSLADIDERCRAAVVNFDCSLIARLRDDPSANAWRDTDGTDTGLIIMPGGEYWDRPAAKCVLRTENGCGDILCAERRYCQRRNRYSVSDILIPAEVLSPSEVDAPVLISGALADLIATECLGEGGFEPAAGSPRATAAATQQPEAERAQDGLAVPQKAPRRRRLYEPGLKEDLRTWTDVSPPTVAGIKRATAWAYQNEAKYPGLPKRRDKLEPIIERLLTEICKERQSTLKGTKGH